MASEDTGGAKPRILVVDDEFLVALDIAQSLRELGCEVIGPLAKIDETLALTRNVRLDGAVLDINLGGARSFVLAHALIARGVPVVFVTGYATENAEIPDRLRHILVLKKPLRERALATAVAAFRSKG
jgi:DNA-binding LytR/AlgR family response regulator